MAASLTCAYKPYNTACPRSLDQIYKVTYNIKWVKTTEKLFSGVEMVLARRLKERGVHICAMPLYHKKKPLHSGDKIGIMIGIASPWSRLLGQILSSYLPASLLFCVSIYQFTSCQYCPGLASIAWQYHLHFYLICSP